jgi:hypothetical protein
LKLSRNNKNSCTGKSIAGAVPGLAIDFEADAIRRVFGTAGFSKS